MSRARCRSLRSLPPSMPVPRCRPPHTSCVPGTMRKKHWRLKRRSRFHDPRQRRKNRTSPVNPASPAPRRRASPHPAGRTLPLDPTSARRGEPHIPGTGNRRSRPLEAAQPGTQALIAVQGRHVLPVPARPAVPGRPPAHAGTRMLPQAAMGLAPAAARGLAMGLAPATVRAMAHGPLEARRARPTASPARGPGSLLHRRGASATATATRLRASQVPTRAPCTAAASRL